MDCSAEEAEIRRALDAVPGIKALRFQLGARTLGISALDESLPLVLDAIRKAGFDPQPFPLAAEAGVGAVESEGNAHGNGHGGTRLVSHRHCAKNGHWQRRSHAAVEVAQKDGGVARQLLAVSKTVW